MMKTTTTPNSGMSPLTPENPRDPIVHLIAARLDTLHGDMQEIKGVQKEMAAAFSKLILIEERQANTQTAQGRAFKVIESLEAKLEGYNTANREIYQAMERRIDALEAAAPIYKQASSWVYAAVVGLIALIAPKIINKLF